MRAFILHWAADHSDTLDISSNEHAEFFVKEPELAVDMLRLFQKAFIGKGKPFVANSSCAYHEHSDAGTPGRELECAALEEENEEDEFGD